MTNTWSPCRPGIWELLFSAPHHNLLIVSSHRLRWLLFHAPMLRLKSRRTCAHAHTWRTQNNKLIRSWNLSSALDTSCILVDWQRERVVNRNFVFSHYCCSVNLQQVKHHWVDCFGLRFSLGLLRHSSTAFDSQTKTFCMKSSCCFTLQCSHYKLSSF